MPRPPIKAPDTDTTKLISYPPAGAPYYIESKADIRPVRLPEAEKPATVDYNRRGDAAFMEPSTIPIEMEKICKMPEYANYPVFKVEWPEPPSTNKKSLPEKDWRTWTYSQVLDETRAVAKAFISLGLGELDGVSILGFNSPFWAISSLGAIFAGGMAAGVYNTDTADQACYKALVSDTSIACVDDKEAFEKYNSKLEELPYLKAIVVWKDVDIVEKDMELTRKDGSTVKVLKWDDLVELGKSQNEEMEAVLTKRIKSQNAGKVCSLIFTSGTTGTPKAVMISHDNMRYQCKATIPILSKDYGNGKKKLVMVSYLPLSHIAGLYLDVMAPMLLPGENYMSKVTIYFARSYDLKIGSLVERLQHARPTAFAGVPRVYEKISEKMKAMAPKKGIVPKIAAFSKRKMLKTHENQQMGGNGKKPSGMFIANAVLKKLHKKIGLDRAEFTISAAAPMKLDVLQYWGSIGFHVSEAYGMSENTGIASSSNYIHRDWGATGFPQSGTEIKIFQVNPDNINEKQECPIAPSKDDPDEKYQGEVCFRGRHIMLGYLANPKLGEEHVKTIKKSNAKTIDDEGWIHSGDKGLITQRGTLKITGRYKEIIIGAGGENISPVPIEDTFKANFPPISNVMMVGDHRKYNVALVTLVCEGATGQTPGTNILDAPTTDMTKAKTITEACQDEAFINKMIDALKATNADGKVIHNNAFKIQKFTILPIDFSTETGELTATLKLKRAIASKKYAEQIEAMYASETKDIFINTLPQ